MLGVVPSMSHPCHPPKPGNVAVSVTFAPMAKTALHTVGQVIPVGELVIIPLLVFAPRILTVSVAELQVEVPCPEPAMAAVPRITEP